MGFNLAYLFVIWPNSKGPGQSYEHFDSEYLQNGGRYG